MYEYLHPEQQLRLVRLHQQELRDSVVSTRSGRPGRRLRGRPQSLRLRPRQRLRRAAAAAGLTRTAGFGAARSA